MSLISFAHKYNASGLAVLPCDKDKRPSLSGWISTNPLFQDAARKKEWKPLQKHRQTPADIDDLFKSARYTKIAIITGAISGSDEAGALEVVDVDTKHDTTGTLWDDLLSDILDQFTTPPAVICKTQSGGMHMYYRCSEIQGNQHLARIMTAKGVKAIIETRGEGGYVVAPPSEGYELVHGDLTDIPTIHPDTREILLDICRKYNQVFEEKKPTNQRSQAGNNYRRTPWDDYNNDPEDPWMTVLDKHGWVSTFSKGGKLYYTKSSSDSKNKANWSEEKRLFYVFSTSTELEAGKAFTPFALYAHLEHAGDFSAATAAIRKEGYGVSFTEKEQEWITRTQGYISTGLDFLDIIQRLSGDFLEENKAVKDMSKAEREAAITEQLTPIIEAAQERQAIAKGVFWTHKSKGVGIGLVALKRFLHDAGYRLFCNEIDDILYRIIRMDKGSRFIDYIPDDVLKKNITRWVDDHAREHDADPDMINEALMTFSKWENVLEQLPRVCFTDINFMRDDATNAYLPFINCVVHITADDVHAISYADLPPDMMLWSSQVIQRHMEILTLDREEQLNNCPFYLFVKRIAGIMPEQQLLPLDELQAQYPDLYKRYLAFVTTFGYLLTNYKDPSRPWSVIFAENTTSDKHGGGAGKDLSMKAIGLLRPVSLIPAKLWRPDKSFAFQTYKMGRDILYLSDVDKFFPMDKLHNTITEGLTLEKKNKDALVLPYELSPKIAISTNYDVDGDSEHASRRQKKLLFHKYYNKVLTPSSEFGGDFWSKEWTEADWYLFYLVLYSFIQAYLSYGVIDFPKTDTASEKIVRIKYSDEFYDFISRWYEEQAGTWAVKKEMYEDFLEDSGNTTKEYSNKRFNNALEFWAKEFGLVVSEEREFKMMGGSRSSRRMIIFTKQGEAVPDAPDDMPF